MAKRFLNVAVGVAALGLATAILADPGPSGPAPISSAPVMDTPIAASRWGGDVRSFDTISPGGSGGFDAPGALIGIADGGATLAGTPTVTAVPEPSAWTQILVGAGAVGAALRIRRRALARTSKPPPPTVGRA